MNITVWNEFHSFAKTGKPQKNYPKGLHETIKSIFNDCENVNVNCALQDEPENGLTDAVLEATDVLIWWSSQARNDNVLDSVTQKVFDRVQQGMGIIFLYGANNSKIFRKLAATSGNCKTDGDSKKTRVFCVMPTHLIANGIPMDFTIDEDEVRSEYFDIPQQESLIFLSGYAGGETVRSGFTFTRGLGKIFYFGLGNPNFPVYCNENVRKIIYNAAFWAQPSTRPIIQNNSDAVTGIQKIKKRLFKWN